MDPAPPTADVQGRASGAHQARVSRVLRVALIGLVASAVLFVGWAMFLPVLTALDRAGLRTLRIFGALLAAAVAISTAAFGPSGEPPGARLGARVGFVVGLSAVGALAIGLVVGLVAAPIADGRVDRITLVALAAGGVGLALTVSVMAGLAASTALRPGRLPSTGMPLPLLIGSATGVITAATWAFATAHLLGHLQASARQTAVEEARDLVELLSELGPARSYEVASEIAPPGGFIARLAPSGEVIPDSTAGIGRDAVIDTTSDGPPTLCHVRVLDQRVRTLPCGVRTLADGTRVVAAASDIPVSLEPVFVFVGIGLGAALLALAAGYLLGRGPAADLARVATVLDQLGRIDGGLDRPIVAVSLDEVGDLAVALDRLRLQLQPSLLEHDAALARARAANDERDQLLALVSEELRLPLDRILGDATVLLDGGEELTLSQREDIRLIVSSATHLTGLIEEVLDLSAIATGQVSLSLGSVELGAVVTDVARAQKPLLGPRQVAMHVELPDGHVRLVADERRLRQVVTNLVSNAVKFTASGTITVAAVKDGEHIVLTVRDTGSGMDPAQLPRLFSEFVQLGTLRERARGTGLGLAICKRIIEAHGGTITAASALGEGTTFTVRLPQAGKAA